MIQYYWQRIEKFHRLPDSEEALLHHLLQISESSYDPHTPTAFFNHTLPNYPSDAQQTAHSALIYATNPSTDPEILRRDSEEITSHRFLLTAEISRVDALVPQIHSFLTQCAEYRTANQNALNLLDAVATTIQSLSRIPPVPQSSRPTLATVVDLPLLPGSSTTTCRPSPHPTCR